MTNDKKQQAIIEAYKALGMNVPKDCNENGWSDDSAFKNVGYAFYDTQVHFDCILARPILLEGIESNNGWERILEDGSNLPTEEGQYFVYSKVSWHPFYRMDIFTGRLSNSFNPLTGNCVFTHYQPIVKPKPPIY